MISSSSAESLADPAWPAPAAFPRLDPGDAHVWAVDLGSAALDARTSLSVSEHARAARFHFEQDRSRYRRGRTALRLLLGGYGDRSPDAIVIVEGHGDKPFTETADLEFNVSHSGDKALIAVRRRGALGVDVEQLRPIEDRSALAQRYFCEEERRVIAQSTQELADLRFLTCWTRKEAYLKASGTGLRTDPVLYHVGATTQPMSLDGISVVSFSSGPRAIAALAQYEPACSPTFLSFDAESWLDRR